MERPSDIETLLGQYDQMKSKHPDAVLLFRVGDFYETYKDDAIVASEILGLTISDKKMNGRRSSIEVTGFPHHALDTYLPKLVRAGKRVAICEQLDDPKLKKADEKAVDESLKTSKNNTTMDYNDTITVEEKTSESTEKSREATHIMLGTMQDAIVYSSAPGTLRVDAVGPDAKGSRIIVSSSDGRHSAIFTVTAYNDGTSKLGVTYKDAVRDRVGVSFKKFEESIDALSTAIVKNKMDQTLLDAQQQIGVTSHELEASTKPQHQAAQETVTETNAEAKVATKSSSPKKTPKAEAPADEAKKEKTKTAKTKGGQKGKKVFPNADEKKAETAKNGKKAEKKPQLVTVNGQEVTGAHAYASKYKEGLFFYVATLDGVMLKPQRMKPEDVMAMSNKTVTTEQMMTKYYPEVMAKKVEAEQVKLPQTVEGRDGRIHTIERFNPYKEQNVDHPDYGSWKFYARIDGRNMSVIGSKDMMSAWFNHTATPAEIVRQEFGPELRIPNAYERFKLPKGVKPSDVKVHKVDGDNRYHVSVTLGDDLQTPAKPITYSEAGALFDKKGATVTKSQLAAKYLMSEMKALVERRNALGENVEEKQSSKMKR